MFVAYPLAFDWMFVAYYFHRFLKRNPFGVSGLDHLASLGAGAANHTGAHVDAGRARTERLGARLGPARINALDDAIAQAAACEELARPIDGAAAP